MTYSPDIAAKGTTGGAAGVIRPGPGGGGGVASIYDPPGVNAQPVQLPPTFYRPSGATDFYASTPAAGVSVDTAASPAELASFTLPTGQVGALRSVSFSVNNLTTASRIRWSMLFNDTPVAGWADRRVFPRAATSFTDFNGGDLVQILIPEGTTVRFVASVDDVGTYTIGLEFFGWHYDLAIQRAYDGRA